MRVPLPPGYRPSASEAFMNPLQAAYFRERLERAAESAAGELSALPRPGADAAERDGDQADQASGETERDLEALGRERALAQLRQVEQALARIDNGTYGYCADTGAPIGLDRLIARPEASLSLDAQAARERPTASP